jgi:hypothetical protein
MLSCLEVFSISTSICFVDNMTGFGRLFADDTCIGHMAHNEENLHTLISTDLEYLNAWSYRKIEKNGPKTDPWGTPAFNSPVLDIASLITTRCFRLER